MGNKFRDKVIEEGLEAGTDTGTVPVQDGVQGGDEAAPSTDAAPNAPEAQPSNTRKGNKTARGIGKVLGGDVLADRMVLRQIPLVLLCLVYLLLIVGNRYRVESLSREKAATEERINYLREHRIQMQKQYQQSVKISQIAEDLKGTGVGITSGPPYEIED